MIEPAEHTAAASWLRRDETDWWDVVRFGPPGFEVYARIAFPEDLDAPEEPVDVVRVALDTLATHTATPGSAYAAIWEGWGGGPNPEAPVVPIPHRTMLLFAGPVSELRWAPDLAWSGRRDEAGGFPPHLAWPEDQAWCLACEVDEEIEFTVGCSATTYDALAAALPGAVRQVQYGDKLPLYRDEVET